MYVVVVSIIVTTIIVIMMMIVIIISSSSITIIIIIIIIIHEALLRAERTNELLRGEMAHAREAEAARYESLLRHRDEQIVGPSELHLRERRIGRDFALVCPQQLAALLAAVSTMVGIVLTSLSHPSGGKTGS